MKEWNREKLSAALCNPQTASDTNRRASKTETRNYPGLLEEQFDLLDAKIIVTLGGIALEALKTIAYHQYTLRKNAAQLLHWNCRFLIPLYHPSPQVTVSHRRVGDQFADYQILEAALVKAF